MNKLVELQEKDGKTYLSLSTAAQEMYHEAFIQYFVKVGSRLEIDEVFAEVEAEKAVVELTAPCACTVCAIVNQQPLLLLVDLNV